LPKSDGATGTAPYRATLENFGEMRKISVSRHLESRVAQSDQDLALALDERLSAFVADRMRGWKDAADAEDVAHDVWLRFLLRPACGRPQDPSVVWCYLRTAAVREMIDRRRRAAVRSTDRAVRGSDSAEPTDPGPEPIAQLVVDEERAAVRRAVVHLDPRTALAVSLRVEDGASYGSIVERCGFGTAAEARRAVRRGVRRISRRLTGRDPVRFVDRVRG
jgi:DNA-directed RNA polymerase specialized sigma24 family protein